MLLAMEAWQSSPYFKSEKSVSQPAIRFPFAPYEIGGYEILPIQSERRTALARFT